MSGPFPGSPNPDPSPSLPDPGSPTRGVHAVRCESCGGAAYLSDTAPPADPRAELTRFADEQCPRGGQRGCPNTTVALQVRREQRPGELVRVLQVNRQELRARWARGQSVVLPELTAATPVEVPITWEPGPCPDERYQVCLTQELAAAALLGAIRVAVKAGSRTPAGCVLLVDALRPVPAGRAAVHAVATTQLGK